MEGFIRETLPQLSDLEPDLPIPKCFEVVFQSTIAIREGIKTLNVLRTACRVTDSGLDFMLSNY